MRDFLRTLRADAMGDTDLEMAGYVRFQLIPVALVVPYFLAPGANGQQSLQGSNVCQGFPKLGDEFLPFPLCLLSSGNVLVYPYRRQDLLFGVADRKG